MPAEGIAPVALQCSKLHGRALPPDTADFADEYERYTLKAHAAGPYVLHERIRLRAATLGGNPFTFATHSIDVGIFLTGDQCPEAKRKLQALLEATIA